MKSVIGGDRARKSNIKKLLRKVGYSSGIGNVEENRQNLVMRFSKALPNFLLGYIALHLAVAAIFLFVLTGWLRDQMLDQTQLRMQDTCFSLREHIRSLPEGMTDPNLLEHVKRLQTLTDARFTIVDEKGQVLVDSATGYEDIGDHSNRPEILEARQKGIGFKQRNSQTLQTPLLYLALPLYASDEVPPDGENGFVRIALEEKRVFETIRSLQQFLWIFTIGSGLLAGVLMSLFAFWEMQPLPRFAEAARSVAAGQYVMLPGLTQRDDEWKSLADAFAVMQAELRQRETRLRENTQRIEAVLGSMVEGVLAVDRQKRVLIVNQAACNLLSVNADQLLGNNLQEIVRIPELGRAIQHTLLTQSAVQTEFETIAAPRRTLEIRVAALSNQREFGAAVVMHDVTELRNLENMRRDFVANVSHELKTPLASIKAYAETLRLGALDDPENRLDFIQQIEDQAGILDVQIADLLRLSELESGKPSFEITTIDLSNALKKCRKRFLVEAERRDLQIKIVAPADNDCEIETDSAAIRSILDNLVSNAIRYAKPSGEVRLEAELDEDWVNIRVIDHGIGISEENCERIFERFYRIDKARSRDLGGTGLGLAIVKHTVMALGGAIRVESKLGQGTTFFVKLPRQSQ